MAKSKKPVVVTTENRGVFFGYVEDDSESPATIKLSGARMCVYWSADVKGILGLGANGPSKECRVTHAIPQITLYKITSVMECSPEAQENWEQSLWKK